MSALAVLGEPHLYCLKGTSKIALFLTLSYLFQFEVVFIVEMREVGVGFLFGPLETYRGLAIVSCTFPLNRPLLPSGKL